MLTSTSPRRESPGRRRPPVRSFPNPEEVYRLLSVALAPPTAALVSLLRGDPDLPGNGPWSTGVSDDQLLHDLQAEHTRLFVNTFPRLSAPPFAAVYLTPEHPERLLLRIEERLGRLGLEPAGEFRERVDHLRLLLEAAGRAPTPMARVEFVGEFLAPWLPVYGQRLSEAAALPLYPGLIGAAIDLAVEDAKEFNI
ncbi:MAG: molecular chaperone TorD family protein [Pseudomonadota bacterium]